MVTPISQASAGRRSEGWPDGAGKCYRLYTEGSTYRNASYLDTGDPTDEPGECSITIESHGHPRSAEVRPRSLRPGDAGRCHAIITRLRRWTTRGCSRGSAEDGRVSLRTGSCRRCSSRPRDLRCAEEILTVVAAVGRTALYRPKENKRKRTRRRRSAAPSVYAPTSAGCHYYRTPSPRQFHVDVRFFQLEGDHLMLLAVYEAWKNAKFIIPGATQNYLQASDAPSARRAQAARHDSGSA